jgi:hypothetical protein
MSDIGISLYIQVGAPVDTFRYPFPAMIAEISQSLALSEFFRHEVVRQAQRGYLTTTTGNVTAPSSVPSANRARHRP